MRYVQYYSTNCLIWTISAMLFSYVSWRHKQNGCISVGTLYREPFGEIAHYDNVYKIKKGPRSGIYSIIKCLWTYFCTHSKFSVCFPVRNHFASLQGVYYFLLLLSSGFLSKTLWATLIFCTTCWSPFRPHTIALICQLWCHYGYCSSRNIKK